MKLSDLYQIILNRSQSAPEQSYTARLFQQGEDEIVKKVGEESVEVILAVKGQGKQRIIEEVADLAYHTLVLMAYKGIAPAEIEAELEKRHNK